MPHDAPTAADATPPLELPPLARLLVEEGVFTTEELRHAARVRDKLQVDRPLVDVARELQRVDEERIREVLKRRRQDVRLGDLLVELGYLRQEYLEIALAIQREDPSAKQRLGQVLIEHHFIDEAELVEVLALHLGFPLESPDLAPLPADLVARAPLAWFEQHEFVPLRQEGEQVVVAFADPTHPARIEAAETVFGSGRVVPAIASRAAIHAALQRAAGRAPEAARAATGSGGGSPVAELLDRVLEAAAERGASSIHLEPHRDRVAVRVREDGVLVPLRDLPRSIGPALATRAKLLGGADAAVRGRHQEGHFRYELEGRRLDVCVSIDPTVRGERIVLHVRDGARARPDLARLGLAAPMHARVRADVLARPGGFTAIAGTAGSGRTTTLYACLEALRADALGIVSLEDPVEAVLDGVAQIARPPDLDWTAALGQVDGQDPDVIAIGALADPAAAQAALRSALAGRRVLAALHAEDAAGALARLLHMGSEPFEVAATLAGVVAQRLLRRVCEACAEPHRPTPDELRALGVAPAWLGGASFRAGRGCEACRHTGYRGRLAVFELLVPDAALRDEILARPGLHALRRIARASDGFVSLFEAGLLRAARGETTLSELVRVLPRLEEPRALAELRRLSGEE